MDGRTRLVEGVVSVAFALSFLAQAAFAPPATVAPLAAPGSEIFEREQLQFERELRQSCISEAGVRLVVENWVANRTRAISRSATPRKLQYDIAAAAYAQPVDMAQLEQAIRAEVQMRVEDEATRVEDSIQLLRRLSSKDRAIYARRFTWMQPTTPPLTCKP